jgi:DNA-binding SARP family transcriptional activator
MESPSTGFEVSCSRPRVRVLGRFHVEVGHREVTLPVQAQRVVGYLAVSGACERRDELAGRLWPYGAQSRADANLRTALWRVRSACDSILRASRLSVALRDEVEVDARTARSLARSLIEEGRPPVDAGPVLGLWEGDLLPGWDEEWLVIERERMRQLRIHGLEALSRSLIGAGRFPEAIDAALAAIAAEPLRETAHAALIEIHLAENNISEAYRQLDAYRRLLRTELGLEPSSTLTELVRQAADRRLTAELDVSTIRDTDPMERRQV